MLVIIFTEMTCAFFSCYTSAIRKPSSSLVNVAFVIDNLIDLILNVITILNRETTNEYFFIIVITFQHTEIVVRTTFIHCMRRDVSMFSNQKHVCKFRIFLVIFNEILSEFLVCSCF